MGAFARALDWSATPLGSPEGWSIALKTMVSMVLANRFPQLLWWGPDYISIYNDAYRPVLGDKHPWALGKPFREVWPEVAHILGPMIDTPFHGGPSSWTDDIQLEVRRHGFDEETHFNFAYSPTPDPTAPRGIGGVLATVSEITEKIVGERRLAALRDLGAHTGDAWTAEEAAEKMAEALAGYAYDIPFALIYLLDADGRAARLAGAAGASLEDPVALSAVEIADDTAPWPLARVMAERRAVVVNDLEPRFARLPPGPWRDPPRAAVVVPLIVAHKVLGFFVAGASPRLQLDESYRSFFKLAAAQISTAIGNARAYEEEREKTEALAAIDRAKTAFFSNISHEFRTPLTLMLGPLSDALADGDHPLPTPQRERIDLAERNGLRLQKLVNALLDFARVEAGRLQAVFRPTDLSDLTRDLASSFRSACERAGLSLTIDAPALPEPVFVDRDMWEKIVLNLLSNAFKFTFEGGIAVTVEAEGTDAVLTVRDTGVGIPEDELPRIFERFHRVAGARGRTHEGTGIGLSLVQDLVNQHGGRIDVRSAPGEGTAFTVRLPLGRAHLSDERIDKPDDRPSTATGAEAFVAEAQRWLLETPSPDSIESSRPLVAGRRPAILVADDNADMRQYLRQLLSQQFDVRLAADGQEALDIISADKPDIVLTDVMMPKVDGFDLLGAIRANSMLADLPVVLLSARAGQEATIEGLDAGADDYLVKPFSARELIARLAANLERARSRHQLRAIEDRYRALVSATSDVVYEMSPDWSEMRTLRGRGFLADTAEPSIAWIEHYLPVEDQPAILAAIDKAIAARSPFQMEHRVRRADGSVGWTFSRAIPQLDPKGEIIGWFGAASDVTERKQFEEHLRLVVNELNHRVKNNLAIVQAMASQTFKGLDEDGLAQSTFTERLIALAKANDLLTGERWVGAALDQVLVKALDPYRTGEPDRLTISGPSVTLTPEIALSLAMATHELATNAVKYGALSNATGRISMTWTVESVADGTRLRLVWRETGGPPVTKPTRRGFGSRLIERGLSAEVGAAVLMEFLPEGLVCTIEAPLPRAAAG